MIFPETTTTVPGRSRTGLAWMATAGIAVHHPLLSIVRRVPNENKRQQWQDLLPDIHSHCTESNSSLLASVQFFPIAFRERLTTTASSEEPVARPESIAIASATSL